MKDAEHLAKVGLQNNPYWYEVPRRQQYQPVILNSSYDAAVIGGGITGVTTAYLLKKKGLKVALIEAATLGYGTTGHTTAHLTSITDTKYTNLISSFSSDQVKLVTKSLQEAIDLTEKIIGDHSIECDFRRMPAYLYTEKEDEVEELKQEFENARSGGLNPEFLYSMPLLFPVKAAIKYFNQAHFHPIKFIYSLAELVEGDGCHVFEGSRVFNVDDTNPHIIKTEKGNILAKYVVYATHTPPNIHVVQTQMKVGRSYIIGAQLEDQQLEDALYWDNDDPYHYFNIMQTPSGTIAMIGGGDHHQGITGKETDNLKKLLAWANVRFNINSIPYVWSGQEYIPPDGLPFIGLSPLSNSKYLATGFSGNGIAFGIAAAKIITDMIAGLQSEYKDLYSPARLNLSGIGDIVELNLDVAKHIIKDRLSDDFVEALDGILPGEGRIVNLNNDKVAVYKDISGTLHKMSPVCTHAKCIIRWNDYEKTWDCPCHGSRFHATGEVLEGPAVDPLTRYEA